MKIIDVHVHPEEIEEMGGAAKKVKNCPDLSCLTNEMKKHSVKGAVAISLTQQRTPFESLKMLQEISEKHKNIKTVFGIDPYAIKKQHLKKIEHAMKEGYVNGIKIFPAYFPKYPNDTAYHKFYKLCVKYDLPAIIHTGAVMKEEHEHKIYQRYAHPLRIDDLAVDFPELRILMAHAGYPWLVDTAQIVYKNDNVWADLSGLREGPVDIKDVLDKHWIDWMIDYLDNDEKMMYGSDWPIVEMGEYIPWMKNIIPKRLHKKFFFENAKKFFRFRL